MWLPGHYGPAGGVDHQPVGRERGPQLHGVAVGRGAGAEPEGHHEGEEDGPGELNGRGKPTKILLASNTPFRMYILFAS